MILSPKILFRLFALCLVVVLLEVSFFSRLTVIGATPEVAVIAIAAIGLLAGSMTGAVTGFSVGLILDALTGAPLGSGALAFMLAGYVAGTYRERAHGEAGRLAVPFLCTATFVLASLSLLALHLLLGMTGPISFELVPDMLLKTAYAFLLSVPVYGAIRRLLAPGIVEEAPFARRKGSGSTISVLQG